MDNHYEDCEEEGLVFGRDVVWVRNRSGGEDHCGEGIVNTRSTSNLDHPIRPARNPSSEGAPSWWRQYGGSIVKSTAKHAKSVICHFQPPRKGTYLVGILLHNSAIPIATHWTVKIGISNCSTKFKKN